MKYYLDKIYFKVSYFLDLLLYYTSPIAYKKPTSRHFTNSTEKLNGSTHVKPGTVRRGFLIADLVILMIRRQQLGQRFGLSPVSHTT